MMRSTASADRLQNWMARGARTHLDAWVRGRLDEHDRWNAARHPWEFWFDHGDELV